MEEARPPRDIRAEAVPTAPAAPARKPAEAPSRLFRLRGTIPTWLAVAMGAACVLLVFLLWTLVTAGAPEERIVGRTVLPSPSETFSTFEELWFDRALTRNVFVTIRRVVLGFALAALLGIPLGILCGCFAPLQAFFLPLTIFGRNIPLAALIPLTFSVWGIGETQKVMFIFIACVMFVVSDMAGAIRDVEERYVDTAWTLGARKRQIVTKVLVPLSMPSVFNSLRILFGLAFGYIMLAELVKLGDEAGGLGEIINLSQRRGLTEHILLVLILIPFVALGIDRLLYAAQRSLFPYRYGGYGFLHRGLSAVGHGWEALTGALRAGRRAKVVPSPEAAAEATPPERKKDGDS
jgi:ABC-type nitrate/sulfonate/bicarbonate transport system permease component